MEKANPNNMNNPSINVYQNIPTQNMRSQNMAEPIIIAQPIQSSQ